MRPKTEPTGVSGTASQADASAEPWIVTESLPFGTDVMQTLPLEYGEGLPVGVALLVQRGEQNSVEERKSTEEGTTKPNEPKPEEPAKATVFKNVDMCAC